MLEDWIGELKCTYISLRAGLMSAPTPSANAVAAVRTLPLNQGYGLSEAGKAISSNSMDRALRGRKKKL